MSKTKMPAKPATQTVTRKPRGAVAPANETKAEKFVRLAETRMSKALKAIKNVGALGAGSYEKTPEQVEKIQNALVAAVTSACEKLVSSKKEAAQGFKF